MLYKHKKQEHQEDISPTTDLTEKEAIIEVHTLSCVFITKPSPALVLQFAHFFRMTSILSLKEEKTGEGSRSRMVKNSYCRETQQEKPPKKPQTLAAKCVKLYTSVGFRSLWFFIFITKSLCAVYLSSWRLDWWAPAGCWPPAPRSLRGCQSPTCRGLRTAPAGRAAIRPTPEGGKCQS